MTNALFYLAYAGLFGLSNIMLAYVSMASYLGPFISPLVLVLYSKIFKTLDQNALFIQAACQAGSLCATALGFILPTIFFADSQAWSAFLASPMLFCATIFALTLSAGLLGWQIALSCQVKGANPTSQMIFTIYKSLGKTGQDNTILFSSLTSGALVGLRTIGQHLFKLQAFAALSPTIFALGLISGTKILPSICMGGAFKMAFNQFSGPLQALTNSSELLPLIQQFCLGALGFDLVFGLARFALKKSASSDNEKNQHNNTLWLYFTNLWGRVRSTQTLTTLTLAAAATLTLMAMLKIPALLAVLTVLITIICTQELAKIVVNIGLAPLGRFATIAMLGSMLFGQSTTVNVLVACFCALSCASAANTVLQMAIQELWQPKQKSLSTHHLIGLVLASLLLGVIFLIFFKTMNFQHGIALAQRAQMRAILMQSWQTQPLVIGLGVACASLFKIFKIDMAMFFAGLLMNAEQTIVFILGGACKNLSKHWLNFDQLNGICSGLLLGESVVVFLVLLSKLLG